MGNDIRNLQTMLRVISFTNGEIPNVIPDGIYGQQTADSVRAFQRATGTPVTGTVDEITWRNITTAYEYYAIDTMEPEPLRIILEKGDYIGPEKQNTHTYLIQAMITALRVYYQNIPPVSVNGTYDRQTERAVRELQRHFDLPETGRVGRRDWKRLVGLYRLTVGNGIVDFPK